MTQWFHRNPLKATARVDFDLGLIATSIPARKICTDAASKRQIIIKMLSDPNLDPETILTATNQYLGLLLGFIQPVIDGQENDLRHIIPFKWSESLSKKGDIPTVQSDAVFDLCSILVNVGVWFSKHAAKISAKENVSMDEAKAVHQCLRQAAGIFKLVMDTYVSRLAEQAPRASDLDSDVLQAYMHQCTAEAQEVTMARAIELNHTPSIISALAYETSQMYENARLALATMELKVVGKWRCYFHFKCFCYRAYAFTYHAETLLAEDKAGDAIAAAKEAQKNWQLAVNAARDYAKCPGAGLTARPAEHCFFTKLQPAITRVLEKAQRENTLIYHQTVPSSIPDLQLKATFGLVAPECPGTLVTEPDPVWKEAAKGFDQRRLLEAIADKERVNSEKRTAGAGASAADKSNKADKTDKPLEPTNEMPIYETDKKPSNESGCSIS